MDARERVITCLAFLADGSKMPNERKGAEDALVQLEQSGAPLAMILLQLIEPHAGDETPPLPVKLAAIHLKNVIARQSSLQPAAVRNSEVRLLLVSVLVKTRNESLADLISQAMVELCVREVSQPSATPAAGDSAGWPTLTSMVDQLHNISEKETSNILYASNSSIAATLNSVRRLLKPLHLSMKTLISDHPQKVVETIPAVYLQALVEVISEKWAFAITIFIDALENEDDPDDEQEQREEFELFTKLSQVCTVTLRLLRRLAPLPFVVTLHWNPQAQSLSGGRVSFSSEVKEAEWHEQQRTLICTFSAKMHEMLTGLGDQLSELFKLRTCKRCLQGQGVIREVLDKLLIVASKMMEELVTKYPRGVARYLQPIATFYLTKLMVVPSVNDLPPPPSFERKFVVYCIRFVTALFEARTKETRALVEHLFANSDTTQQVLVTLLTKFMITSNDELSLWESDPQQLMQEQLSDDYQYSIRPSAEFLWLAMVRNWPDRLPALALNILQMMLKSPSQPNSELEDALRKTACYAAFGLCHNELYRLVNFKEFFKCQLMPDLQNTHPSYKLVKRQVCALLCEEWRSELDTELFQVVYEMLIAFLASPDYVVAVWAAIALRNVTESVRFSQDAFSSYMTRATEAMIALAHKLQQDVLTTAVVDSIGLMCRYMAGCLSPAIRGPICKGLLNLWEHSPKCPLLRNSVLTAMASLINSASGSADDRQMEADCVQLVLLSTDVLRGDKDCVYTTEGLRVWQALIERPEEQATSWFLHQYPPALAERIGNLLTLPMSRHIGPDVLLSVVQHHLLAHGAVFLSRFVPQILTLLEQVVGEQGANEAWLVAAFSMLHVILMMNPTQSLPQKLVAGIISQVGIEEGRVKAPLYIRCHALAVCMRLLIQGATEILLLLGPARDQFLSAWNSLMEKMVEDAIFARLNCLGMVAVLSLQDSPLKGSASMVVQKCIAAGLNAQDVEELSGELYAAVAPSGFLKAAYQKLWMEDPVNMNVCSLALDQMRQLPQVASEVTAEAGSALKERGSDTPLHVMPIFGRARAY